MDSTEDPFETYHPILHPENQEGHHWPFFKSKFSFFCFLSKLKTMIVIGLVTETLKYQLIQINQLNKCNAY